MIQPQQSSADHLRPGTFIDSDHPDVMDFSSRVADAKVGDREKAVALYYAVRASAVLARGSGFCIAKAVLLAAGARHQGIPARLGKGDPRLQPVTV
jgi:transglutaminase-like putative cysteine protease